MTSRARGCKKMVTQPISAVTKILVRVLAFARVREIAGHSEFERELDAGATIGSLWAALVDELPELAHFSKSIRFAHNGQIAGAASLLEDGDEVALLPPVSGG